MEHRALNIFRIAYSPPPQAPGSQAPGSQPCASALSLLHFDLSHFVESQLDLSHFLVQHGLSQVVLSHFPPQFFSHSCLHFSAHSGEHWSVHWCVSVAVESVGSASSDCPPHDVSRSPKPKNRRNDNFFIIVSN